jgi:hypothetical protein
MQYIQAIYPSNISKQYIQAIYTSYIQAIYKQYTSNNAINIQSIYNQYSLFFYKITISYECYARRGWPEDKEDNNTNSLSSTRPFGTVASIPTSPNNPPPSSTPLPSSSPNLINKTPAQIVAELKDTRMMRRSSILIFSDKNANTQIVVDGKDEAVRRMIPHVYRLGLRVVPSLDVLDRDALARSEKIMDIPAVDWDVLRDHLPAKWRRGFFSPNMVSGLEVLKELGPLALGVAYGTCRSYIGMQQTYMGSQALKSTSFKWRVGVALRCGVRTGFAVAFMSMLPEISRWITCHTQNHFDTPKGVVVCSVAEGTAIVCTGAYLLRNCHYWFLPFLAGYAAPKQVLEDLVLRLRD